MSLLDLPIDGHRLLRHAGQLWATIHPAYVHAVSWVISPAHLDAMRLASAQLSTEPISPPMPDVPLQLFGMPVRTDEYAMIPMLELR